MRRFDYSIEFKGLTFEQRAAVWRTAAEKYGLLPYVKEADIERFALAYETSAGIIDTALRDAGRVQWAKGEAVACTAFIEKILSSHHAMASGRDCAPDIKKADTPEYGLEGLSVNCDIPQMMNILEEFNQAWAAGFKDSPVFNMNVLLYGPPGTGKTELAKYVARRLNRKPEVRPASDMLNKYVGETEKAIRAAFREAENERAILLIDEADSFFYNRESATHSLGDKPGQRDSHGHGNVPRDAHMRHEPQNHNGLGGYSPVFLQYRIRISQAGRIGHFL